jgi:5-methylcytosine-specific restriction endonuclease McrA
LGKLKHQPARLAQLPPRIRRPVDAEGHSPTLEPWRRWYGLAEWKRLKARVHRRDLYTCQMTACGKVITVSAERVADHIKPHRGDRDRFFDETNVHTLCKPCHDRLKQASERRSHP